MWVSYESLDRELRKGDQVLIVDRWVEYEDIWGDRFYRNASDGGMDCWLGKVMTVNRGCEYDDESYSMVEDDGYWCWYPEMIDAVFVPDVVEEDITDWEIPSLNTLFEHF